MNLLLTSQWQSFVAWAALITAIAGAVTVLVRVIQVFSRSFSDLMNTLEEDNQKLREALSLTETSRTELADQLVRVHKEVAATVKSNSEIVLRLQSKLDEYRQSNQRLLDEVQSLKAQIMEYVVTNRALSEQIAQLQSTVSASTVSESSLFVSEASPHVESSHDSAAS